MQTLIMWLLLSLFGATVGAIATPACDSLQFVCNCSFTKNYDEPLNILCVDSTDSCTWFHTINDVRMPIEERFSPTNITTMITLLGYYDNLSYGYFAAINSTGHLCNYLVVPPLGEKCPNCTGIEINGTLRNNNEILCTYLGDNVIIRADIPLISSQYEFMLRLNDSNCPQNCEKSNNLTYNCNNLTASNTGVYCIHVSFTFDDFINPEWQSNNVTIVVQSLSISFTQSMYSVIESAGRIQPALAISNPSLIDITVEIFTTNVTALGGNVDYGSGPYTITVPAGNVTVSFEVKINNDNILEGNEIFSLAINLSALPDCIIHANIHQATVTIVDDDVATVTFEQAAYNVSENNTTQLIVLILSKPSSTIISLEVFDVNTTAFGRDVDYSSGPYNVMFSIGQTHASFHITIHNDSILENNETFTLNINVSSLPSNVMVGDPGETTVTIVDDDVATVNFEEKIYCVTKNDRQVQPALTLSDSSSTNVTVEVCRTAVEQCMDSDHEPFNVTFLAGDTCGQFDVPINESTLEDNEANNFTLIINPSSLPSIIIVGDTDKATVIIRDNCSDDDDSKLNAGEIAGIIVGSIGGIILITIAIVAGVYLLYRFRDRIRKCLCEKSNSKKSRDKRNDSTPGPVVYIIDSRGPFLVPARYSTQHSRRN